MRQSKIIDMKLYYCPRCGKKFHGRMDYCPRCAQHIIYEYKGEYFDALGNRLELDKTGKKAKIAENNPKAPR